jgi:hypothetical protein
MPVKGMQQVKKNTAAFIKRVEAINEKTLTMIGAIVISNAKPYVPLDTGNLQNSDFRQVLDNVLRVGYTADYALPLHGTDSYSPIWRPRSVGTKVYDQGKGRGARVKTAANMEATPQFLSRGVDDSIGEIQQVIESEYRKA